MPRDHQQYPDPKVAGIVSEAPRTYADAPTDLDAAWAEWSSHIQKVDECGMALIRAAFEAGCEASRRG